LTWLYVPGDRPDRFASALSSGADVVIVDLEDGVHPSRKAYARSAVSELLSSGVLVQVRVNADFAPDLEALGPVRVPLRLPKVESPSAVLALVSAAPGVPVHCLLETALGVENAFAIATAHPSVASIGLGESDLRSDLGLLDDGGLVEEAGLLGEAGLLYARGRVLMAARAAQLPPPAMSIYPDVRDLEGLAASCRRGRALGFLGRAAIHPRQIPVIASAFRPSDAEVAEADALLDGLASAEVEGRSVVVLPDGRFADPAMVRQAQLVQALGRRPR
jgi:citrate lyase subunit beta/citryl-CoA lyase